MSEKLKKVLGQNVNKRRLSLDMSIAHLARTVGVSPRAIRKLEDGQVWVSSELLVALAKVFHCEPWQLLKEKRFTVPK